MKAILLAAGRGSRMRPLTDTCPKPLLKAGGKRLIEYHLEKLAQAGFREVVINHAWLGQQFAAALGNGDRWGLRIHWSAETEALETAGGIQRALPLLGDAPFLVISSDIWTDFDFAELREQDLGTDLAHLVMVPNAAHHPAGDFILSSDRLSLLEPSGKDGKDGKDGQESLSGQTDGQKRLIKKTEQSNSEQVETCTYSGMGIYHPALFETLPAGFSALRPLLESAIKQQRLSARLYHGEWSDIGSPQRLATLDQKLSAKLEVAPE